MIRRAKPRRKPHGVIVLGAALTTTASFLLGLDSATAAGSAQVPSWPSQVAHPVAASCPRGQTPILPTSGWTDALGVAHVRYKALPGLVSNVAPRGLTARRVTSAVIADLGLAAVGQPRWRLVRQALRLAAMHTAPAFCRSQIQFTHVWSSNWGGYGVTETEHGNAINAVRGQWTVGQSMTSSQPSAEATWVGVGGGIGGETKGWGLIQDGTSMRTNNGYQSWFEYIGSNGCCGAVFNPVNSVRPGDQVAGEVWWGSSTNACFYFTDFSRSGGDISTCKGNLPIPYDHTSAEWVNENLLADGYYYDNPGTTYFHDQALNSGFSGQGTWVAPFSGSYEAIIMYQGSPQGTDCSNSNVLSYPENATGGSSDIITCTRQGIDSP